MTSDAPEASNECGDEGSGVVFVVGAGFSHAVNELMPLTSTLGTNVIERIIDDPEVDGLLTAREAVAVRAKSVPYNNIELWLSSLATPQPHHNRRDRHRRAALFDVLAKHTSNEIARREHATLTHVAPDWLLAFVTALHYSRCNVITFNYDTLLEATVGSLFLHGKSPRNGREQRVLPHALVGDLPPSLPVNGGRYGPLEAATFRLLKMHGSTTWFGRGGDDLYSIVRDDRCIGSWTSPANEIPPPVSGMENVIVPPIADKSHLYRNPTIAGIWSDAAAALRSASTVVFHGYSLPATDYSAGSLFGENAPESFDVVDPSPDDIVDRISNLVPGSRIETECVVENYVDGFVAQVAAGRPLDIEVPGSALDSSVVVTDALNTRRSVVRIDGQTLELGDATQRNPPEPGPTVRISDLRHARNIRLNDGRTAPLLDVIPRTHPGNPIEYRAGVLR